MLAGGTVKTPGFFRITWEGKALFGRENSYGCPLMADSISPDKCYDALGCLACHILGNVRAQFSRQGLHPSGNPDLGFLGQGASAEAAICLGKKTISARFRSTALRPCSWRLGAAGLCCALTVSRRHVRASWPFLTASSGRDGAEGLLHVLLKTERSQRRRSKCHCLTHLRLGSEVAPSPGLDVS